MQLLIGGLLCQGQPVDVAREHESGYVFLNGHISVLQAASIITLDSVLTPPAQQRFASFTDSKVLYAGYDPHYYWYRFTLRNKGTVPKNFVLLLGGSGIREAEVWESGESGWRSLGKTGYQYPFIKRPYPFVQHAFPIALNPRSTQTFYVRKNESHAYKIVAFVLVAPKRMQQIEHRYYFLSGIITGVLSLFFLLNVYLYLSIREKIHVWYALYIAAILLFLIKNAGLDAQFLGLDSAFGYRSTYMGAVASLAVGFLLQVVQLFLFNIRNAPWLYKSLLLLKWSAFVTALVQGLVFYFQPGNTTEWVVFEWSNKTILLSFLFITTACCYSFYKGFKPALFLLIAQVLFIIGGIARTLFLEAEAYMFPPSIFEMGLVAEVMIISYGLMYRYNQYKRDKDVLREKLDLQQAQTARQIVAVQAEEQKRIAEDLHDELGGNLAAIKMTLQSYELPEAQSQALVRLLDRAAVNARNIAHNLMPPEFEQTNLDELLRNHYSRLGKEGAIAFQFYSSGANTGFSKQDELMIYRILMELTSNIIKHSGAREATVQLVYHEDHLSITTEDNGKGFAGNGSEGIGLKNIQSRVSYLNGSISIDSGANGSTTIIHLPYRQ